MNRAIAALFLFLPLCSSLAREGTGAPRPFTRPSRFLSVVRTSSLSGSSCTGYVAKQDIVITAGHCTRAEGEHLLVTFESGESEIFIVKRRILINPAYSSDDMAILAGPTGAVLPIPMGEDNYGRRTWCVAFGYGDGLQKGTICRSYEFPEAQGLRLMSGRIVPGDSGGPVVSMDGRIIGISESYDTTWKPLFWIVPVSRIQKFMEEAGL